MMLLCLGGLSRPEHRSGWLCPPPGIEPRSPALQGESLPSESPGKPLMWQCVVTKGERPDLVRQEGRRACICRKEGSCYVALFAAHLRPDLPGRPPGPSEASQPPAQPEASSVYCAFQMRSLSLSLARAPLLVSRGPCFCGVSIHLMILCSMLWLPWRKCPLLAFIPSLSYPNKLTGNSAEKLTPPNALLQRPCSMHFSQKDFHWRGRHIFSQIY